MYGNRSSCIHIKINSKTIMLNKNQLNIKQIQDKLYFNNNNQIRTNMISDKVRILKL